MKHISLSLIAALTLSLVACSKTEAPSKAEVPAVASASSYDIVATTGKGFSVGAMMSAQTVYVLFDPQCPHCGHLWQASLPLHSKARFVWIPIAFNTGKSLAQAAALLSAANPLEAMSGHEQSLLAGTGGMSASADVSADLVKSINSNTQLLTSMGVDSVPYLLAKNKRTGQVVSNNGAMDTPALAQLLGLD
jgi:thiol:disulfide interchange protein DsbG